jgi:hypothetical protein
MKNIFTLSSLFICSLSINAQSVSDYWKLVDENKVIVTGKRDIVPEKYKTFHLDVNSIKTLLATAPLDKNIPVEYSSVVINLPMPDGSMQKFKVSESPVMDDALQAGYPGIRTYNVRGIDDKYASGKLDMTEYGFHGMIRSPQGDVFIDPYCKWNVTDYITYYTSDFVKPLNERGVCEGVIGGNINSESNSYRTAQTAAICAGANLKTYRLAVGCTGEYARAACGTGTNTPTTAQILAKVVTSVNRVDGVYETEVAVKLVLVSTTTLVLYGVPGTGYTTAENNNASSLISKSQSLITSQIGSANFDIGHTFSTGGGGLAQLGCVCSNGSKASGITGSPSPVGDAYDIDYVAHEIGHQFAGNHTFNGNAGSCSGNRNPSTAVEPGSGITIMAYAGICTGQDMAAHSIAYFHAVSYDEITNFINSGNGNNCDVMTATGNHPPVATVGAVSYTVPAGTPFTLTGSATDQDGDALTYQWEEIDLGSSAGSWNTGNKPFFKSHNPTTSPSQNFPDLAASQNGSLQAVAGEYTPLTTQTLKFRFTARDNRMGGGGVCSATTAVQSSTVAGPFVVTSQSVAATNYPSGSTQTVNWNVANTNLAPFNVSNVNIYLSTNNGVAWTLLLANTPNDGSESVTLPTVATTATPCRIKVESVGSNFFSINKKFFIISAVTGLSQATATNISVKLYPNPFSNTVKVDINAIGTLDETKTVLNVYDILGNLVRTESIKLTENFSKTYDLSALANGSYIVVVTDGKQKSVTRLIKM